MCDFPVAAVTNQDGLGRARSGAARGSLLWLAQPHSDLSLHLDSIFSSVCLYQISPCFPLKGMQVVVVRVQPNDPEQDPWLGELGSEYISGEVIFLPISDANSYHKMLFIIR